MTTRPGLPPDWEPVRLGVGQRVIRRVRAQVPRQRAVEDLADVGVVAVLAGVAIGVTLLGLLVAWWAGLGLFAALLVAWGMRTAGAP